MNHVCPIAHTFQFAFLNYEHVSVLPPQNRCQLLDITLALHAQPMLTGPSAGVGCDDVRIYVEGKEVKKITGKFKRKQFAAPKGNKE